MHRDPDSILHDALKLSDAERLTLVNQLLESLPEESLAIFEDQQFQAEMDRRSAEESEPIPWSQIRNQL